MSSNSIRTRARAASVFAVLDDPCAYPRWVVGSRRVRAVDASWPAVGSRFHHALGTALAELHDSSKILERNPPHRLVLEVRFRPTGVANVDIRVHDDDDGCIITIVEEPTSGPVSRLPRVLVEPLLALRNVVSLRRLRRAVERSVDATAVS